MVLEGMAAALVPAGPAIPFKFLAITFAATFPATSQFGGALVAIGPCCAFHEANRGAFKLTVVPK